MTSDEFGLERITAHIPKGREGYIRAIQAMRDIEGPFPPTRETDPEAHRGVRYSNVGLYRAITSLAIAHDDGALSPPLPDNVANVIVDLHLKASAIEADADRIASRNPEAHGATFIAANRHLAELALIVAIDHAGAGAVLVS